MKLQEIIDVATFPEWQLTMIRLTIIYRILECGDQIPINPKRTNYEFIERVLDDMYSHQYLDIDENNEYYIATKRAETLRAKMVEVYDHALKFEIFGTVNLAMELPDNIVDEHGNVLDHCYDPRFEEPWTSEDEMGTTDLRIAMMTYLSEYAAEENSDAKPVDPRIIVFMQWLCDGKLKDENIWFDLKIGTFFKKVEEIIEGSYKWTDIGETEEESWGLMAAVYTAGMLEQRKRDGFECSNCEIPLAVFELNAQENGEELRNCPNPDCGASYEPPEPPTYECPKCSTEIKKGQKVCSGCSAEIDFNLSEGTIKEETQTITETEEDDYVWDYGYDYYGYGGYGYYDPYMPLADALIFCAAVDMLYY